MDHHENDLHFRMPENYLRAGNIFVGLLSFLEVLLVCVVFLRHQSDVTEAILYRLLALPPILIGFTVSLFSTTEVTVDFQMRNCRVVQRRLWMTKVRRSSLNDYRAVHVTEQGYVSLIGKNLELTFFGPLHQVVPLGNTGFGGYGAAFANEVARRSRLGVITKLNEYPTKDLRPIEAVKREE